MPGWSWHRPGGGSGTGISALHEAVAGRALSLSLLRPEDAGNYTCTVENVFGRDEVVHVVVVQVPPGAPALSIVASSHDSLSITWRDSSSGGSPILGYTLKYRRELEEWQQTLVDPDYSTFTVRDLRCGSSYQMSMSASNAIGPGKPSAVIMATTKGSAPTVPPEEEFLQVNSTAATVYLEAWPDGGCPLRRWEVEHRSWAGGTWARLPLPREVGEELVLGGLTPGTWYALRVTAHNDAGSCRHQFVFATRTRAGEMLAPYTIPAAPELESTADMPLNIVVPIVSGIISTIAVSVCACLLVHKRNETCYAQSQPASETKSLAELQNQRNSKQLGEEGCSPSEQMYLPSPLRKNLHKDGSTSGQEYEIGPYEMFSLPTKVTNSPSAQTMDYCVQFQTFSQQECAAGCHNHGGRSAMRSRSSRLMRSSDSLEISCISSQQTLQLGARATGLPQGRADPSDSDSSGPDQHSLPVACARRTPRREGKGHCEHDSTLRDALPRQHKGSRAARHDNALDRLSAI